MRFGVRKGHAMTTETSDGNGGGEEPRPPASRLEREVAEILERSEKQPISFVDEVQRRANARRDTPIVQPRSSNAQERFERLGSGRYLILAVVAGILAFVVGDFSPLLANILAIICVAAIFVPVVQRFRQPESPSTTMWRGRDLSRGPDWSRSGSRPAGLERILDRFRKPPRI